MWRKLRWEITFIVALFVILPLGLYVWQNYTLGRKLDAELEKIRQRGEPLTWADAAPAAVPDEDNGALLYQQVFQVDFKGGGSNNLLVDFDDTDRQILDRFRQEPNADDAEWLRGELADPVRAHCLQTLREASSMPHAVFDIQWDRGPATLFPHYACFRSAARVMVQEANLAAYDGDMAEALDWHATIMRMSRHILDDPALIGQLVAIAMQSISFTELKHTLRDAELPPGAADELDAVLASTDMRASFRQAMMGERAFGIEWFDAMYEDPSSYLGLAGSSQGQFFDVLGRFSAILGPLKKGDKLTYLDLMTENIAFAGEPLYISSAKAVKLENRLSSLTPLQAPVTKILYPVFSRAGQKADQTTADITMCRLVLALKAIKRDTGAYPQSLDDLQPSLNWSIGVDPFSGKPYIYITRGDGFILYSVGRNTTDDGGKPERDPETGDWQGETSDIVWECTR